MHFKKIASNLIAHVIKSRNNYVTHTNGPSWTASNVAAWKNETPAPPAVSHSTPNDALPTNLLEVVPAEHQSTAASSSTAPAPTERLFLLQTPPYSWLRGSKWGGINFATSKSNSIRNFNYGQDDVPLLPKKVKSLIGKQLSSDCGPKKKKPPCCPRRKKSSEDVDPCCCVKKRHSCGTEEPAVCPPKCPSKEELCQPMCKDPVQYCEKRCQPAVEPVICKKKDPCKREDPCKKKEDPCKKKEDPCKKKEDPCKKKKDPCKKKKDPCKKKKDPCKKKKDPCKKKKDPCKKKKDKGKKKEDPCKKKKDKGKKKEDPCKKKEDPCKKKEDPCKKKEDPCKKKKDPCKKKKKDPCKKKKQDPCKKKKDPCKKTDPCKKKKKPKCPKKCDGATTSSKMGSGDERPTDDVPCEEENKQDDTSDNEMENEQKEQVNIYAQVNILDTSNKEEIDEYYGENYKNKEYMMYNKDAYSDMEVFLKDLRSSQSSSDDSEDSSKEK